MLAAMEDLLDTWPGTLLVVSHDRYLLERITDQQYAVIDGGFRHLPGGVDEYLKLAAAAHTGASASNPLSADTSVPGHDGPRMTGAEARAAQKEVGAIERRMDKLGGLIQAKHQQMADHDQSDFEGLGVLTAQLQALEDENAELEERWLELSEQL